MLDMPKHLTSACEQMYQYLELKKTQKEEAKLQKVQHREERAQKKKKHAGRGTGEQETGKRKENKD